MCGIFGLVKDRKDKVIPEEIRRPLRVLAHRGPDGTGTFIQRNVGLGHNRLAIFDQSAAGAQPMTRKASTIIFNGAVYNFPELQKELRQFGYRFQSNSDTEVILAAYDHWGHECVKKFNGQWAFAIYDKQKQQLFCSRDRFGIKPFYYTSINGRFYFSSEIKAFTNVEGWQAKLNRVRAYEYLVYGYHDHTSETLFEGVYQLPKGNHLLLDVNTGAFDLFTYYKLNASNKSILSLAEAKEKFQALFEDAVRLRLRSDVPVGSALSGGLDSSSIVASIFKISKGILLSKKQHTISACFPGYEKDESKWIDLLTNKYELNAEKVFPKAQGFLKTLEHLTWHQDEPLAGASIYAQYEVFQKARKSNIPVMLDGQGADEILAGYDKFFLPFFKRLVSKNPLFAIIELFHYFQKHQTRPMQAFGALKQFRKKKTLSSPDWLQASFHFDKSSRFNRSSEATIRESTINLIYEVGLSALLHYEDRNAMAWGVESRLPFLDHRLVEFCLSLPDNLKITHGKRKRILRHTMKNQIPKEIINRYDKIGFAAPQEKWMEINSLSFKSQIAQLQKKHSNLFNKNLLHLESKDTLWRVWSFGVWMEVFNISAE